jgi:hypothetical protein
MEDQVSFFFIQPVFGVRGNVATLKEGFGQD